MPPTERERWDRYPRAASELLKALRGGRSQRALAQRLGYRSNICTDWEHGRRYPTAAETLRVAQRVGKDLTACFAPFGPAPAPTPRDGFAVPAWLDALRGSTRVAEVAARSGYSRSRVGRWLSGESAPRLPEFLRLLDALTGRAAEWAASLVPIADVPTFEATFRRVQAAREVALELPWSEAVLRVIETTRYQSLAEHEDAYVAAALGVKEEAVRRVLEALTGAGVVERVGPRYVVTGALLVDTRDSAEQSRRLRHHWATVALRRVQDADEDWFAYNVISVSVADCDRIERILRAAYREIRAVVAESTPCEQAALLTLHLSRWGAP